MNLLPIEIYLFLLAVIPLGICFSKWKHSTGWILATITCAALSWCYFNLAMVLDPPDNGFANAVFFFTGWVWMLPVFVIFWIPFRLLENRLSSEKRTQVGAAGLTACVGVTALVLIWNCFGSMTEGRAIIQARKVLRKHGHEPSGQEIPTYDWGYWIVRYPDSDFGEIRLTRNGKLSWIGGPG